MKAAMYEYPYGGSFETRVLAATGVELVVILYEAAIEAVESARRHLKAGQIVERSRAITKAVEILVELAQSLDHEKGGELSARLAGLYSYMQRLLLEANFRQQDDGLAETAELLKTLRGAWAQVAAPRSESSEADRDELSGSPQYTWAVPGPASAGRQTWSA